MYWDLFIRTFQLYHYPDFSTFSGKVTGVSLDAIARKEMDDSGQRETSPPVADRCLTRITISLALSEIFK
ncbi:MAG: hypothetical protein F6K19_25540 [Cyanothece sp. SIO1E1]|nr:hypothetical protein [Cyanothece sp. SIO1E1]